MIKKPFLIAEIGINHNGSIKIAKKLIDIAKDANFNAVKFQKRDLDEVYSKDELDKYRVSPWGTTNREQKKGLEFGKKDYKIIDNYCKKKKIDWFASAWDFKSLEFLDSFNLKYNKIASAMIISKPFLEAVAKRGKYTFISTGMSTNKNIDDAVKIFNRRKCKFELMHCVSTYPMKTEHANLETINALRKKFKCKVGYSGHENGIAVSLGAYMMGATSLERHITLDRTMYGTDQAASLEYSGMKMMTEAIEKINLAIGKNKIGKIQEEELPISKKLRSHLNNEKFK